MHVNPFTNSCENVMKTPTVVLALWYTYDLLCPYVCKL